MENTFFDLLTTPDITYELFLKAAAFSVEFGERACNKFPLDWLWTWDDVGGQQSMMISPELWRDQQHLCWRPLRIFLTHLPLNCQC